MSLINDALRRARNASRDASNVSPVPAFGPAEPLSPPPMPSGASAFPAPPPFPGGHEALPSDLVDEKNSGPRSNRVQLILAVVLVLAVGVAAGLNYLQKKNERRPVDVSANAGRKAILPDASAIQKTVQTLSAVTNRAAAAGPVAGTVAVPAVASAVVTPPSAPPKFPTLRLQSIFYRVANPSVMINGRTLYLNDEIQGVIVADIQPYSATLVLSGHTNVLTLR